MKHQFMSRIKCLMLTGHRMGKYQSKIVNGVYGKVEAQKTRCADCQYVQKYWVIKEKLRQSVRCN